MRINDTELKISEIKWNDEEINILGHTFAGLDALLYNAEQNNDMGKIKLLRPIVNILDKVLIVQYLEGVKNEIK